MMRGIRARAVVWGFATDVGATFVTIAALGIFLGMQAGMENMPQEEAKQYFESLPQNQGFLVIAGLAGLLATVLGGYVAGKVGKPAVLLNAGCVGVVGIILGVFFLDELSLKVDPITISVMLTLPAALLGGLLAR